MPISSNEGKNFVAHFINNLVKSIFKKDLQVSPAESALAKWQVAGVFKRFF